MSANDTDPLLRADQAAMRQGAGDVDEVAQACPLTPRHAIEVCVVGMDDAPLADVAVELRRADGMVLRQRSGGSGVVRFDGLEAGSFQAALYELDRDAWDALATAALTPELARGSGDAAWSAPVAGAADVATVHAVQPGECMARLGAQYGFTPETLWELPENKALRARRASMYVLYAGGDDGEADRVTIPALRPKSAAVASGYACRVRRKAVPELFVVQMLRNGKPRANVAYLFAVSVAAGVAPPDREGKTDADGYLREAIPPAALKADVTLLLPKGTLEYRFALGEMDPIETVSGTQARLSNLGYLGDDATPQATAAAIARFQQEHGLAVDPEQLDAMRRKLQQVYG